MNVDLKQLTGIMNLDSPNDTLPKGQHKSAFNVRFRGVDGNLRVEGVPGTVLIPNGSLPIGDNQCVGAFYDSIDKRIIWFNYNSNTRHGIYQYSVETQTISKVFLCFTDSATDILAFDLDYPIHSAAIVYRSSTDGDLLYWTDDLNRPKYLNLDTVSSRAPFTSDMVTAAKNAPTSPPFCIYQDDAATSSNYLNGNLWQFSYRIIYANAEKSNPSPWGKMPLPTNGYTPDVQNDPTKNNNILIQLIAPNSDGISIELIGRQSVGATWSDAFSIGTFKLSDYNVPPNTTFNFYFYNDGVYVNIDPEIMGEYFYLVPDKAKTLELLNGNTIIYGGIVDGKNGLSRVNTNVSITSDTAAPNIPTLSFTYAGAHEITLYVGTSITAGAVYHASFDYNSGSGGDASPKNISYTTLGGDTQPTVAVAIAAALTGSNITATHVGAGYIRVITSTGTGSITNVATSVTGVSGTAIAAAAWRWSQPQLFGLQYLNDFGKPIGGVVSFMGNAVDTNDFAVTTPDFITSSNVPQVPFIQASINHTPPTEATCYHWVRADLKPKFIEFVTNDYQTDANFLYLCIQNIYYTKDNISGYVPTYQFSKRDRIKIVASFNSGTGFYTPYNLQLDMEILGTVQRTMTSPASLGTFLKVAKPTTFPSSPYIANMYVAIYTPLARVSTEDQFFFEWGQRYSIYELTTRALGYTIVTNSFQVSETITQATTNATATIVALTSTTLYVNNITGTFQAGFSFVGLSSGGTAIMTSVGAITTNRYHSGQIVNQSPTQAALFQWFDGDVYFRGRTFYLNVGGTTTTSAYMMDANYSDYFSSAVNSNGRGWIVDESIKLTEYPNQVRWGQSYQQDTNVNELNRFKALDFDTIDLAKGWILRMLIEERILYVYQEKGVGKLGIYSKFIQDASGSNLITTTDEIITRNNVDYLLGNWGLGNQPCNLFRGANARHYFVYDVTGDILRRSDDGITSLSEIYYGQYTLRDLLTKYNDTYLRLDGSKSKILGYYDFFEKNAHFILQKGSFNGGDIDDYNILFHEGTEARKGFCSLEQLHPEWILQADKTTYAFKDGQLYVQNDEVNKCKFFGVQYYPKITLVFNDQPAINKVFNSLGYQSEGKIWESSKDLVLNGSVIEEAIQTSFVNPQTKFRQTSRLKDKYGNYEFFNGKTIAALLRDINSKKDRREGLWNGDFLEGNWIQVDFEYKHSDFATLFSPYLSWEISNRNF